MTAATVAGRPAPTFAWDADNRLVSASWPGTGGPGVSGPYHQYLPLLAGAMPSEQYVYDQDGQWVEKIVGAGSGTVYTFYVGPQYELQVGAGQAVSVTKYYYFGSQRVAERQPDGTLAYLHADHLGSVLLATDVNGGVVGNNQVRYDAYGNQLYGTLSLLPTDFDFTGQKRDGLSTGFYQMGARWYDPYLNQWIQPDTIVPDLTDPQSLNRYMYARGDPLRYNDPGEHDVGCPGCDDSDVGLDLGVADGGGGASWDYSVYNSMVPDWAGRLGSPAVFRPEELAQAPSSAPNVVGEVAIAAIGVAVEPEVAVPAAIVDLGTELLSDGAAEETGDTAGLLSQGAVAGAAEAPGAEALSGAEAAEEQGAAASAQVPAEAASSVETPYGPALQEQSDAALAPRRSVGEGATIYRQGRFPVQETDLGQFWAPGNPLTTEGHAQQFGMAGTNEIDWVMGATADEGADFVTRSAPAFGNNPGGALEVVTQPGGVDLHFFYMP
jgi:RHS repeat-associated protein